MYMYTELVEIWYMNVYPGYYYYTFQTSVLTIVSWVSAHGRLNVTRDFGPHAYPVYKFHTFV